MHNQFEDIYKLKLDHKENAAIIKKQVFIEDAQKKLQSKIKSRPSNIKYFEDLMYNRDFFNKPGFRVGYFCNLIPQEIIWALGAEPVRLDCGSVAFAQAGEEVLSGEVCPLAKASFASLLVKDSLASSCDILVIAASCDAKRKLAEILNDFKPTFVLNLPTEKTQSLYAKQSYKEILRLVAFLEKNLKTKLKRKELKKQILLTERRTYLIRQLQTLRIEKPEGLSMRDFLLIIQSGLFRPIDFNEWYEQSKKVYEELKDKKVEDSKFRFVLTGAPIVWPNFKILNLIEEIGACVVADTLCSGAQSLFDPVVLDETSKSGMLKALVNKYIYSSICPCFISQTTRINRVLDLVEESKAGGVINNSLRLCQLFDIENYRLGNVLKEKNISYLNIRSDYSLEDTEQLRVRLEAFLESLT